MTCTSHDLEPSSAAVDTGITLDVPAAPRSLRLLRLAAADAAADAGFDLDAVESARIAVDELASLLLADGDRDRLVVTIRRTPGRLVVDGSRVLSGTASVPEVDPIVVELLDVCVSTWSLDRSAGRLTFRFEQLAPG
jgi:hypothetical protein